MRDRYPQVTEMDGRAVNCPRRGEVDLEVCLTCGWNRGADSAGGHTILHCGYSGGVGLGASGTSRDWAVLGAFPIDHQLVRPRR